jgi:hypothetical protein
MAPEQDNHVAVGWTTDGTDGRLRWIEVGRVRLEEEDKDGAAILIREPSGATGLSGLSAVEVARISSTELAGLVRHLAGWFADDPTEAIGEIEASVKRVRDDLEAWNDRARIDEEHPPYDDLTRALDGAIARCRRLREDIGKFEDHSGTWVCGYGNRHPNPPPGYSACCSCPGGEAR